MELTFETQTELWHPLGRTLYEEAQGVRWFNWTAAGIEVRFHGTKLDCTLQVEADYFPTEGDSFPWLAVFVDDEPQPRTVFSLPAGTTQYTLFESDVPATHRLRLIKRSEASKGRAGVKQFTTDGTFLAVEHPQPACRLEFIGDSITCGFGDELDEHGEFYFSTKLENGFATYSATAAGLLNADYNSICVSGIPLCNSYNPNFKLSLPEAPDFDPPRRAMEDYYAYTDRYHQECNGVKEGFTAWDFTSFVPDAIIINLGTNDSFRVRASGHDRKEEQHFEDQYVAFLHQLRRLNGPASVLACTLGSMEYYLYDNILRAVQRYQHETGDERVFCLKYGAMFLPTEGTGALGHPSVKSQQRMGRELAAALAPWLNQ